MQGYVRNEKKCSSRIIRKAFSRWEVAVMASSNDCKNCLHSKEDHHLVLGRSGGGDFLAGTSMPSGKLKSSISCTKCTCNNYAPIEDSEEE